MKIPNICSSVNSPAKFCCICGKFTIKSQQCLILYIFITLGCHVGDEDKNRAPYVICSTSYVNLIEQLIGNKSTCRLCSMNQWEPVSHLEYFCLTKTGGFSQIMKAKTKYPNVLSTLWSIPHGENLPVLKPPSKQDNFPHSDDETLKVKLQNLRLLILCTILRVKVSYILLIKKN